MMVFGVQKIAKHLGEAGCYFLSLCKIAEGITKTFLDPILEASQAIQEKTMGDDCFIKDAGAIMTDLARSRYMVIKAGPGHTLALDYVLQEGEHEVLRFERPNPDGGEPLAHFVVGAGDGKTVAFDPWPGSLTVSQGVLISRRIIRPLK
jgi:hypothetical protein